MDIKGKKRERNVNFTREETEKLISLVDSKKNIIENKKSDAMTWHDKEMAWNAIEREFNSSAVGIFRDAKHLKLKFEALKRETRKKASVVRAERYKTGGGTSTAPPLTPLEQKVKEMILLSVEGEESVYDSDQPVVAADEVNIPDLDLEVEASNIQLLSDTVEIILELEDEPNPKKICLEPGTDSVASTSKEELKVPSKKWTQWKPSSLKSKKHPSLCQTKDRRRPFDKLAESKMEIVEMQKKLIEEEMEENKLRKQLLQQILQEEISQKKELFLLEKQEMLLKIELLEIELVNKKQNY